MTVLIFGGTSDAKTLALALHNKGIEVIYSIAGLVRQPDLPCKVISGGFSIRGGLSRYILDNNVTALLDATHPFAYTMSQTAITVSEQLGIVLWRYQRPDWVATPEDDWTFFDNWDDLLQALAPYQSIFLTQGQLSESMLATLYTHRKLGQRFVHRTAVAPKHPIPDWVEWIQGIGPFSLDDELAILGRYQIEAVVSKHSGGAIPTKLMAARHTQVSTLLLERQAKTHTSTPAFVFSDLPTLIDRITLSIKKA